MLPTRAIDKRAMEVMTFPFNRMKRYLVRTVTGRRFIVSAKDKLSAGLQVSSDKVVKCPWSDEILEMWIGEGVSWVSQITPTARRGSRRSAISILPETT